jgi:FkbM family methyltransferase
MPVSSKIVRTVKEVVRTVLPQRVADHTIRGGSLQGAVIHTSWHDYPAAILGTTERPLLDWFASNTEPGETWLDIGGHYGYTAIALSKCVGPDGRVFVFEPVIGTAACLSKTRSLNKLDQLTVVPLALGAEFVLQALDIPTTRGMADSTLNPGTRAERVFTIALDAIWESISSPDRAIHGVKIDVQGLELQVLLGMREQLARWNPKLVIEFHRGVDRNEILELLASCGYSKAFEPVGGAPRDIIADDISYVFLPEERACVYSSTRSTTGRN